MKLVATCLLLLAVATTANAQAAGNPILKDIQLGNGLYQALKGCHTPKAPLETRDCLMAYAYISGVIDNDNNISPPSSTVIWEQAFDIVEDYLTHRPEKRQLASVILIKAAFKEASWWRK